MCIKLCYFHNAIYTIFHHIFNVLPTCNCVVISINITRYLEYSLTTDKISTKDLKYVVKSLASNPDGFHLTLTFMLDYWKVIVNK